MADKKGGELGKAFLAELPEQLEEFHVPIVIHKLKYLRAVHYFDEKNDYLKKSISNPYFDKTISEARRAHGFKQPPSALKVDSDWWEGTRTELLRELFECQFGYANVGFKLIDDEPGEFNKSHIPTLDLVLTHYVEVRRLYPMLLEPKKGHLALKIGYTYVNLGHSHKEDAEKALQYYRDGFQELKSISASFRDKMPEKERGELRKVEDNLKERLDKSK